MQRLFDGVPDAARSPLDHWPSPFFVGVEGDVGDGIRGVGDDPRREGGVGGMWGVCVITELQAGDMELAEQSQFWVCFVNSAWICCGGAVVGHSRDSGSGLIHSAREDRGGHGVVA